MNSSSFRDLLILALISGVLLVGAYFFVKYLEDDDTSLAYEFSVRQEEELGNLFKKMILTNYERIEETTADSAVQAITKRLLTSLDTSLYKYEFTILDSDEINAFTIPGGNIYIFSGLITLTESPEELAAVLAHEIGHAEKRHVVTKLVKEVSLTTVLSILSGGDPSVLTQLLKDLVGNTFDREKEKEADQFALELLEHASISPKSLARFFDRLNKNNLDYDKNLEILMTHPHNDSRIEEVRNYKTKNSFEPKPFDMDWSRVKASLN